MPNRSLPRSQSAATTAAAILSTTKSTTNSPAIARPSPVGSSLNAAPSVGGEIPESGLPLALLAPTIMDPVMKAMPQPANEGFLARTLGTMATAPAAIPQIKEAHRRRFCPFMGF